MFGLASPLLFLSVVKKFPNSKSLSNRECENSEICASVRSENRRRYFPVQSEQTRLIKDLLYGFVDYSDFRKMFAAQTSVVYI